MCKCSFGDGMKIYPDGINELDPCTYKPIELYTNCVVEISKCKRCGKIDISWYRTDETEKIDLKDEENGEETCS